MDDIFEYKTIHGNVRYAGKITEKSDTHITVNVYEINYWDTDNSYDINDGELAGDITIKWDGCSHVNFGDKDGYMHLCGKLHWIEYTTMLITLYEWAVKYIKCYDVKCAEG